MSFYRIEVSNLQDHAEDDPEPTPPNPPDNYIEKAIKLIPADVVAAYLALRNLWLPNTGNEVDQLADAVLQWGLPLAGLVAVGTLRILGTSKRFGDVSDVQWSVVVVACLSYLAWIFSFNQPVFELLPDPRISGSLLIIVSIVGPYFVKPAEAN